MEYKRAATMPALLCFIQKGMKLAAIFCQTLNILLCVLRRKQFVQDVLGQDISPLYAILMSIN